MRTVVTGEAVELDLPAVSPLTRGAALLVDLVVYWGALLVIMILLGFFGIPLGLDEAMSTALLFLIFFLCLIVAPVTVETLSRGRSLGKLIFGIRVVREDGGAIRFRHALIRGLVFIGEVYFTLGLGALLFAVFTRRGQRLGDLMAGTFGVRTRQAKHEPLMLPVPQHLRSWAEIADIGQIPDPLAAQVARLLRVYETGGKARNVPALLATADRLARDVGRYATPPAPPCLPAEFLAAVMAARRNREYQRLSAQQQRQSRLTARLHALPYS
ncbi:RDD family protein [Nesterenkonia flava]|uniref:RDD family protein n=1 Tax=Nesterenkonia flava TaxID=469799 RepID=A0ABU1FR85_9MICC|nr:RDD family protein [Nesterenkonia flava]MDR5710782.1 RDD family protein [Nesterenkonia flava]